mgnify:CR=1 FL=1
MSTFQVCPVCMGRGMVPHGFYNTSRQFMSTSTADENCRRCVGTGTIATPDSLNWTSEPSLTSTSGWIPPESGGDTEETT